MGSHCQSTHNNVKKDMETAFAKAYPEIRPFLESVPKPNVKFLYGTAGFRMQHDLLPSIFARVGIIAVLRSKYLGKVILRFPS